MSKFNSSVEKREIWPGIVSVMVPLIQLTSVVVIGLSDTFHIAQLLIFPEILNIVHLLTMLVIVSGIGWFWYWRSNINSIIPIFDPKTKTVKPNQIIIEKINRFLVVFSVIFLLIFIFITIAGYKNLWGYSVLWGILQYIAYSLLLITTGFSIYIWIFEFIQKKQTFRREDFIRNLVLTLEEHGLIERAKFEILGNEMDRMTRIVKIRINDQTKVLYTSFDGLEINKVLAIEEYKQIETPRSKEELKIKIAELSEQLRGLDAQLNSDNQNQPQ